MALARGAGNYPWKTKMVSNHDVDLADDTGDEAYNAVVAEWLPRLFDMYDPKLVYFQAWRGRVCTCLPNHSPTSGSALIIQGHATPSYYLPKLSKYA